MKLPNFQKAYIDIRKLRDYCLNDMHPRGKNKAKVFKLVLGIDSLHAEELKKSILKAIVDNECKENEKDFYGKRYTVDFIFRIFEKEAKIRTSWIIRKGEDFPRLTSCYVRS